MIKLNSNIHPLFSATLTENLRRRNIITIVDFVNADPIKLATFTGLSHTDILQVKQHIVKNFGCTKKNAVNLLAIERGHIVPTSVICLDELLKGGLYSGQLYELCGPSSSGKTQLCLTIAANATARLNTVAWYFDTKKDFSKLRYEEILKTRNLSQKVAEDALQRMKVCYVYSPDELIQALRQLVTLCKMEKNNKSLKERKLFLVIIDSLPAIIFKVSQHDKETIYELDELAEICRFLTRECHAVVITVNLVTWWNSQDQAGLIKPALGKYWMNVPVMRLLLTRQNGETRRISVWRDSKLEENLSCIVTVNNTGMT
ncbi:DNA repair protein RAD51 homolog 4 [Pseudomyrmex gracilis]|uniref:DNA repair protein RAD51 homolog 4 n=1 Tax=Pseudomyrmex gracilis TaxID=219809 RepID=UPI000995144B|nr:DNA repair protein RAD51 homolog 4 [Pseudomyrmex gracilis]XP_020284193.1 DNA repair protein RAD51 homolog 4 [Pseudomyrmex gracilis]